MIPFFLFLEKEWVRGGTGKEMGRKKSYLSIFIIFLYYVMLASLTVERKS